VATQITDEALLAAAYIRSKFRIFGKSDFICNQDITFIEKLFKEYPDRQQIRKIYRTAFFKVRDEQLPDEKWLHLISIFRGYFGIITYPDLPDGTPVVTPSKLGEGSLLSVISRLPGAFLPRDDTFDPEIEHHEVEEEFLLDHDYTLHESHTQTFFSTPEIEETDISGIVEVPHSNTNYTSDTEDNMND
jgi:hypothetical protein